MRKQPKVIYKKRKFLNTDPSMSAAIVAVLEEFEFEGEDNKKPHLIFGYPTLDISDCSNKISLDLSFHNKKAMHEARKKLEILRTVVNEMAVAFDKEIEKVQNFTKEDDTSTKRKSRRTA